MFLRADLDNAVEAKTNLETLAKEARDSHDDEVRTLSAE